MNQPAIGTRNRTLGILNRYHLSAKKSLGQNFLDDLNVLEGIVAAANVTEQDDVVEIGPGIGALTEQIAQRAHQVLAFEIDQNLMPVLAETLADYKNVTIVNQDFLQANVPEVLDERLDGHHELKAVANLPYYITKPILMNFLKGQVHFATIVLMMQKEVASRLVARPNSHDYGALSVMTQYLYQVEIALEVSKKSFIPAPKVDSAVVKLTPRPVKQETAYSQPAFFSFVHGCFMHRRKTLWNNLQSVFDKQPATKDTIRTVLATVGIEPNVRPQTLGVSQFITLTNEFHKVGLLK
ncbi:16S rRNA (adenine(1518)-N(6)/adenine(1519)-N(6))-dimethyltransferase RsmA [Fructilactobacillus cliffordii]|uniref:16S rRNA (adenine(1518)-N(6)/adenine(1519)-N(6))- dimethyltransferase RsmA n=1 Tax=Fructilactobacillus cliffordii TaxID=2940299 RepID=UPI002093BB4E|nr:16S rRNA (adenine(1518)-N(6)/adenine(1519)-N(6))-dimethyltransferase RsmA [Fructilactobacillus cliffordii]USS87060.1 16S rRNA (adenine(1518)-N(6)/adenine(1519)-N(6))-dimethyltransferase RsmA [Fructilactobacillus cliffordii]